MLAEHAHSGTRTSSNGSVGPTSARLGGARADFVAGLGRKVADLRTTLARVKLGAEDPRVGVAGPRDELRRKLHALGSAAKMMKFDAMDRALKEAIGTIDRAAQGDALSDVDLAGIEQIVEDLPALAWGDGRARSSRAESAERASLPKHRVLVVGSSLLSEALVDEEAAGARELAFACENTPDAQAAYDLVRSSEPDLVLLDADLSAASELVEALMDDPLTEAVPIVVVGTFAEPGEAERYVAMGVARTVGKPTSREALRRVCEDTLSPERALAFARAVLGEPTLEELGDRLANEIREAIVGRADPSARTRRIPLGQGTEVLGAVWGAIARVREVVTARSDGAVRFTNEGAFTGPLLSVDPDVARGDRARAPRRGPAAEVRLQGRRVLVVDDDPAVVWFLADLLKTAGCIVHEAFDGQEALEVAYKTAPDLVISDILMPKLDGFSLCRALRRDVSLRDTPVIMLSWKEDLLQRVRELGANAAGYVRKESDTRAILARVREALRTRGRIEARLREDGEVRGRVDGISIRSLLEIVCATRPEARVSVRDASFLYEVEIRFGAPQRATRTDGDGSFLRGSKVLAQMLGVSAGRFTVVTSSSPIETELDGNLAAQLAKPTARARAAVTLLTGPQLNAVGRVRFDDEALEDYLRATPERARVVARRLMNGAAPRELLLCGGCEPALLDDLLCDLAARGFVTAVEGIDGEDMLAPAVSGFRQHTDTRASFAPRTGTPSPVPAATRACVDDAEEPSCVSPAPGATASLEDAVLRELSDGSPAQAPVAIDELAIAEASDALALPEPSVETGLEVEPLSAEPSAYQADEVAHDEASVTGTPPVEQIVALAEPTVVDDTVYAEAPRPELADLGDALDEEASRDLTPFAAVTATDEAPTEAAEEKPRRRPWPMLAFVAAAGVVAWAVLHYAVPQVDVPELQQTQLEAPATEMDLPAPAHAPVATAAAEAAVDAAPVKADTAARASSPAEATARVLAKPAATIDAPARQASAEERGCTTEVHGSRVARVKR